MQDIGRLENFEPDAELNAQASYSSITLHRKCAQAWYYRHVLDLEQDRDTASPYLTLGRWWSALKAIEVIERGRELESLIDLRKTLKDDAEGYNFDTATATTPDVLIASQRRWKGMSREAQEEFVSIMGEPLPDRLGGMFKMWHEANEDRFDRERPIGVELFWKRALPRPEKDAAWSMLSEEARQKLPTMNLIGFVDYVYFDRERKMVVVRDDKTSKDLSNATSAIDDLMDSQLMLYAWGIAPKLASHGIEAPRAVSYDRVRSVAPRQPQLTAAGGLSKAVTAYDLATYRRWAMTDGRPSPETIAAIEVEKGMVKGGLQKIIDDLEPGPFWGTPGDFYVSGAKKGQRKFGTYQLDPKVLEALSAPGEQSKWLSRTFKPVNGQVLRAHLRSAVDTAADIFQTQLRAQATGEAARNLDRRGCQMCDFAELCRAQLIGGAGGEYDLESFGLRVRSKTRKDGGANG